MMKRTCLYSTATFLWTLHLCVPFEAIAMGGDKGKGEDQKEQNYVPVRSATENREAAVSSPPPPQTSAAAAAAPAPVVGADAARLTEYERGVLKKYPSVKPLLMPLRQAYDNHNKAFDAAFDAEAAVIPVSEADRSAHNAAKYVANLPLISFKTKEAFREARATARATAEKALNAASPEYRSLVAKAQIAKAALKEAHQACLKLEEEVNKEINKNKNK